MKDAFECFEEIEKRITRAGGAVVMLDFDGTLAAITADPRRSKMSTATREALVTVACRFPTAIITGRMLSDIKRKASIRGVGLVGNHGLEFLIRGKHSRIVLSQPYRKAFDEMRKRLMPLVRKYSGAYHEDKMHTITLHYRHVPKGAHGALRTAVRKAAREVGNVRIIEGIFSINILPAVKQDKGVAARRVWDAYGGRAKKRIPIFIGDDVTDEDVFRALRGGITVHVGKPRPTAAKYHIDLQKDVARLLTRIAVIDLKSGRK
jgi:trehalose-phosphatase